MEGGRVWEGLRLQLGNALPPLQLRHQPQPEGDATHRLECDLHGYLHTYSVCKVEDFH